MKKRELDKRECTALIVALRLYQQTPSEELGSFPHYDESECVSLLEPREVDQLCEDINCGKVMVTV